MRHDDVRALDRDRLFMIPQGKAAAAAYEALFPIQSASAEEQLAGVALLFAAFTERCGVDPEELYTLGRRLLRQRGNAESRVVDNSLQALRDFAGLRLMGDDVSVS